MANHVCPCCGYPDLESRAYVALTSLPVPEALEPPYVQHFGDPSYEVCDCCGFEFGNDDDPGIAEPVSFSVYLKEWVEDGAKWFAETRRPSGWTLAAQLEKAGIPNPEEPSP
jgi:hypothetical protein